MPEPTYIDQGATFSLDRRHRYTLWRAWAPGPRALFCMLNPSTADESVLDPTLRRCLGFAQRWHFAGFEVVNLFALRSTDPARLCEDADPVGPGNDVAIVEAARRAGVVVCGWGVHGTLRGRDAAVLELLAGVADLVALRLTKGGAPSHPLYLPADLKPLVFRLRRAA
jgi:hypothetical protein